MLINLRNALMAGKRLPYDAEVEYLESTGTQYVDTGVDYFADFEVGIKLRTSIPNKSLGTATTMCLERYNANNPYWSLCVNGTAHRSSVSIVDFHTMSWKGGVFAADGVTVSTVSNSFASGTMTLFGAGGSYFPSMIYACKLWDSNGVLVRDFIPVRKGTVGALYDRRGVGGMNPDGSPRNDGMYFNRGSGDFALGPDAVPVEYIESHGTEWINSGVVGEPNIIVEAVYSWGANAFGADNCLVGANNSNANNRFIPITTNSAKRVEIGAGGSWLFASPTILYDKNITYTARSEFVSGSIKFSLDGTTVITQDRALTSTQLNMFIFASNENGGRGRLAHAKLNMMKIIKDSAIVRSFLPVRVGTGSTWQGAMMDVLTRRIYRNAGTGAFGYGNDLKYPIPAS